MLGCIAFGECSQYSCAVVLAATSLLALIIEQFDDLLVKILLSAAVISFVCFVLHPFSAIDFSPRFPLILFLLLT